MNMHACNIACETFGSLDIVHGGVVAIDSPID
jgi:hypothetical protein